MLMIKRGLIPFTLSNKGPTRRLRLLEHVLQCTKSPNICTYETKNVATIISLTVQPKIYYVEDDIVKPDPSEHLVAIMYTTCITVTI